MTKQEFIKSYIEKSEITEEEFLQNFVVLPCKCSYEKCKGWAVLANDEKQIKAHKELYT